MLNKQLAKVLIEKNLIVEGMELTAKYRVPNIDGMSTSFYNEIFTLNGFVTYKGSYYMDLTSTEDGDRLCLRSDTIVEIEGMSPKRFAESYELDELGQPIVQVHKKRGRKSKAELLLLAGN